MTAIIDETCPSDGAKPIIPGLAGFYRCAGPFSYAFVRIVTAALILPGGVEKLFYGGVYRIAAGNVVKTGFSEPLAWAWAVCILEFFGALMLAAGLLTRPVAVAMAIEMAVITFRIHFGAGFFWADHGYEFALMLMLMCLAFAAGGGGRYSLDRLIGREF